MSDDDSDSAVFVGTNARPASRAIGCGAGGSYASEAAARLAGLASSTPLATSSNAAAAAAARGGHSQPQQNATAIVPTRVNGGAVGSGSYAAAGGRGATFAPYGEGSGGGGRGFRGRGRGRDYANVVAMREALAEATMVTSTPYSMARMFPVKKDTRMGGVGVVMPAQMPLYQQHIPQQHSGPPPQQTYAPPRGGGPPPSNSAPDATRRVADAASNAPRGHGYQGAPSNAAPPGSFHRGPHRATGDGWD